MEEFNGIALEIPGTVTIGTEEYTELVAARVYLSLIMEAQNSDKSYMVDNVTELITKLVRPVRTAAETISGASDV